MEVAVTMSIVGVGLAVGLIRKGQVLMSEGFGWADMYGTPCPTRVHLI